MRFTKMHGLGNDYIYINGFEERVADPAKLARVISDRHRGVGSDGLILIQPSKVADVRMEMYNSDGSRSQMCGNGIRCVAKFAVDHGLAPGPNLAIETDAGVKAAECRLGKSGVEAVRIDMGIPELAPSALPCTIRAERMVDYPLAIDGRVYRLTCVSMGNPHVVVFVAELASVDLNRVGPRFERAPQFPERINAHFVHVDSRDHVTMKTWERGAGPTQACGTGASAVCVAGALTDRTNRRVTIALPGGDLELEWGENNHVYKTGPAVEVFTGDWTAPRP